MFLRKPSYLMMLAEIGACIGLAVLTAMAVFHAGPGCVSVGRPRCDAPSRRLQRLPSGDAAALLQGGERAGRRNPGLILSGQEREWFSQQDPWPSSPAVPIQFRDPAELGPGKLLVASRGLGDPHFAKTVILLVHYDERGVVGLVLNRRSNLPISRVFDLKAAKDRMDPVYFGGPVQPSVVFALMQSKGDVKKAEQIFDGVYLISDKSLFEHTLASQPDPSVFHVYLGYAGWTTDQLRNEVKMGAWFIFPAKTSAVFNADPDVLWNQMIRETQLEMAQVRPLRGISPRP